MTNHTKTLCPSPRRGDQGGEDGEEKQVEYVILCQNWQQDHIFTQPQTCFTHPSETLPNQPTTLEGKNLFDKSSTS
jgi:hypothetical protein